MEQACSSEPSQQTQHLRTFLYDGEPIVLLGKVCWPLTGFLPPLPKDYNILAAGKHVYPNLPSVLTFDRLLPFLSQGLQHSGCLGQDAVSKTDTPSTLLHQISKMEGDRNMEAPRNESLYFSTSVTE